MILGDSFFFLISIFVKQQLGAVGVRKKYMTHGLGLRGDYQQDTMLCTVQFVKMKNMQSYSQKCARQDQWQWMTI